MPLPPTWRNSRPLSSKPSPAEDPFQVPLGSGETVEHFRHLLMHALLGVPGMGNDVLRHRLASGENADRRRKTQRQESTIPFHVAFSIKRSGVALAASAIAPPGVAASPGRSCHHDTDQAH